MSPEKVIVELSYLLGAILLILGLKRLSHPSTARGGNAMGASGMLIIICATLTGYKILDIRLILAGLLIGAFIGVLLALRVKMTAMPQMVSLLNGFGGGASALVGTVAYLRLVSAGSPLMIQDTWSIMASLLIGTITFSGSFIAFGKLQGIFYGPPLTYPFQKTMNALLFLGSAGLAVYLLKTNNILLLLILLGLGLVLGVAAVIPIGGADMPVVISLLNSYSGLAGAAAGFVLASPILIISGSLVGASGIILTRLMCKAMNRSLANVLFSAFGKITTPGKTLAAQGDRPVNSTTAEEAATLMAYAQSVIFVPGYGLAVSQAQHQLKDLANHLEERGVEVKYAVHPVAGRMPGHMNVLLAEAEVPYTQLHEMDDINPEFDSADVALVVGANDVVNPAARNSTESPIYGMPILDVDKAKRVIFLKRSLRPGFAGIENELFYDTKTLMLFGDAKASLIDLGKEVKTV